jgi:hypothetical protein
MKSTRSAFTPKRRAAFLAAIAKGMSAETAATAIGVTRRTVYHWRETDEQFKQEWIEASDLSVDALESKLYDLAKEGDITALIFALRSRRAETYNPNLVIRKAMLQLALDKARSEAAGVPLMIEGQIAGRNGMVISTEPISIIQMPWNARGASPHAPGYDLDSDEPPVIVPVEQDGSGKTMNLPRTVLCEHHSPPYEHLPVHLMADGETVAPEAATDLWARILAHNMWLRLAYPALAEPSPVPYPTRQFETCATAEDEGGDDEPPDAPADIDYSGGFGRP